MASFVNPDTWEDALTAFGAYGAPGGEPEEIDRQVKHQLKEHPLEFLMTKIVVDPDTNAALSRDG